MTTDMLLSLMQETLKISALLAAPVLIASMVTGLLMSVLQTVTSIQEQTLTFVPKIAVSIAVGVLFLPWSLQTLVTFTVRLFEIASTFGR